MAESSRQNPPPPRPRLKPASGGGEIVEVQGGHIVRSTGRKDRHSKVCTAKGPRDRRVRLAAHTAIQFYDVQDRLGYDRPSKAVDWLIKKAKTAIDELAQLPAWHPTNCSAQNVSFDHDEQQNQPIRMDSNLVISNDNDSGNQTAQNSSFLPPPLDSDAIADTIKSFFPIGASNNSSAMQFDNFPTHDLVSRNSKNSTNSQDLRLSLQSFQDPIYHSEQTQTHSHSHSQAQVLLSGTPLGFDGWAPPQPDHHQAAAELSRFQKLPAWNFGGEGSTGYMFNLPPQLLGQNQFGSQRGPLQSSNTPAVRAWMDPSSSSSAIPIDHHHYQPIYQPSISVGGFSGFHIPARIQGDEEEHNGYQDKPSSASSDSRH